MFFLQFFHKFGITSKLKVKKKSLSASLTSPLSSTPTHVFVPLDYCLLGRASQQVRTGMCPGKHMGLQPPAQKALPTVSIT